MNKCKVCKENIKQSGPGRPRKTHKRCAGAKSTVKRTKKGAVRRYSSGATTRSQKGRSFFGKGTGWLALYHGGRTGDTQHDKTWAVRVVKKGSGWTVVTRHGRRTGQKNETSRKIMTRDAAEAAADRLIRSKLRKGYIFARANRACKRGRA
jgi:predicted DNA-binding WGR domain protein